MDVLQLRRFYRTPLGRTARRLIAARLRGLSMPPRDARVLGLGHATPWLDRYGQRVGEVFSFMPARQGVVHWPQGAPAASVLTDETALPLADATIDLALVAHGLELTEHLPGMLAEIWRVLAPQGRMVAIVPNRRGLWARMEATPFGHGRPFSRRQLEALLEEAHFRPLNILSALFVPPVQKPVILRSAPLWERLGNALWQGFSGVMIIEAAKQVHARPRSTRRALAFPALRPAAASPGLGTMGHGGERAAGLASRHDES